jgi:hypothetical protein
MALQVLRLISGEELIGEVNIDLGGSEYNIDTPIIILPSQDPQTGKLRVGMAPWVPYLEGPFNINKNLVMFVTNPDSQLMDNYKRATSPVVVPPQTLITA